MHPQTPKTSQPSSSTGHTLSVNSLNSPSFPLVSYLTIVGKQIHSSLTELTLMSPMDKSLSFSRTPLSMRPSDPNVNRSEERRVGKECRSRWSREDQKK